MNLTLDFNNIEYHNIYFHEAIKNTVITDSNFIRLLYSDKYFVLNGLYINLDIKYINNAKNIMLLTRLEKELLDLYNSNTKHNYKLKDQYLNFFDKYQSNNNLNNSPNIILKISGIWENNTGIGITNKFIQI